MRWVRGPRLDPRGRLPKRIGAEHLKRIWDATSQNRNHYQQHLSLAVLALLYGTGLRRGELERLELEDWKRDEGILQIDGRKTGQERNVPVSEGIWRCVEAYLPLRQNLLERHGLRDEPALLWSTEPANPTDLNAGQAFAPASAWNVHATDINEAGTVLTGYNDTSGNFFTFLLQPN